jgi:hypothetical protein
MQANESREKVIAHLKAMYCERLDKLTNKELRKFAAATLTLLDVWAPSASKPIPWTHHYPDDIVEQAREAICSH